MTKSITVEQAVTAYGEGKSLSEIGRIFGCHAQTVLNRLQSAGAATRSVSESLKGRKITWASKIGAASSGRKHTDEAKAKIALAATGRSSSTKGLRKATHPHIVKCGNAGEKHWNWKGGISLEANRFRQSSEYKAWRDEVFLRDNWTCVLCKKRGGYLEADHIKLFSKHPELRLDVNNGRTLCKPCHKTETRRVLYER
jgi:hypothetical protein